MTNPLRKLGDRLTLVVIRVAIRELRTFRQVFKDWIDTYRLVHGLQPLYTPPEPVPIPAVYDGFIKEGDYLSPWLITQLAYENRIAIDADTDIEALAKDRGWVTPEGKFLMFPLAADGQLDQATRQYLRGDLG